MSYMRGDPYIWSSEAGLHIWTGLHEVENRLAIPTVGTNRVDPIPAWHTKTILTDQIFDELVAMHYAQLVEEGRAEEVERRAIENWDGNGGCDALLHKYGLPDMVEQIGLLTRDDEDES